VPSTGFSAAISIFLPIPVSSLARKGTRRRRLHQDTFLAANRVFGRTLLEYQISGTVMQTLAIDLLPGEIVYSQTNCMCWMNDAIEMNTSTGGGFLAGVGRMFGGGSLFITDFTARGNGHVAFAPRFPGTIKPVQLAAGESVICRKQTFRKFADCSDGLGPDGRSRYGFPQHILAL
jgi:hypothetical protein